MQLLMLLTVQLSGLDLHLSQVEMLVLLRDFWCARSHTRTYSGTMICQSLNRISTGAGPAAGMSLGSPGYIFFMLGAWCWSTAG